MCNISNMLVIIKNRAFNRVFDVTLIYYGIMKNSVSEGSKMHFPIRYNTLTIPIVL